MNKNALLPDYRNSGGRGKTKKLKKEKVGRPRRITVNGEYQTGINITEEVFLASRKWFLRELGEGQILY